MREQSSSGSSTWQGLRWGEFVTWKELRASWCGCCDLSKGQRRNQEGPGATLQWPGRSWEGEWISSKETWKVMQLGLHFITITWAALGRTDWKELRNFGVIQRAGMCPGGVMAGEMEGCEVSR